MNDEVAGVRYNANSRIDRGQLAHAIISSYYALSHVGVGHNATFETLESALIFL